MLKRLLSWLPPLAMLVIAGIVFHADPPAWQALRHGWFDMLQRAYPRVYQPAPVRIVDIDDESLRRIGQMPWPRDRFAALLAALDKAGAAAVAFDIIFPEPDRLSPARVLKEWATQTAETEDVRRKAPDYDQRFAEGIGKSNVVTGFALGMGGDAPVPKTGFAIKGDDPTPTLIDHAGAISSLPMLTGAATGNGAITSITDADGMLRRLPLVFRQGDRLLPGLAAEALRITQAAHTDIVQTSPGGAIRSIRIGQMEIPTVADGSLILHLTPYTAARYVPAWKVLAGQEDASLKDAIVFVGTSAAGLKDLRATALDPLTAGVELHAQAIEQILLGDYLSRPDWMAGAELSAMLIAGLALLAVMARVPAICGAIFAVACVGMAAGISVYAYRVWHMLIDPLGASLVLLLVYLAESLRRYMTTERERRDIRQAFGHYVSPALLERLAAHPEALKLGGEMREMTVMFSDIRGFTALSERYDAESLTRFINRFLTPMTEIILSQQGTIDKYMGDCVMAFWNAPLDDADHAVHACRAALAMQQGLVALNAERRAEAEAAGETFLPVEIGIGLNTGTCCVGNMGSAQRFDYSVLGDDVNLASRLEGQSTQYGITCVIGASTQAAAAGMATIELDRIRVKGKAAAVTIHGLLGDETLAADPRFAALREAAAAMLAAYRAQRWDEADVALSQMRVAAMVIPQGLDRLIALYAGRIAEYRLAPPGETWDGVFTATSK